MSTQPRRRLSGSVVFLVVAAVCFVLAAFSVKLADINLFYLGLAFWVAFGVF